MKHATIVTVIDRVAADAPRCCIAQVRALLNRVRAHHRREQATPRIDARSRIGNDSDPWSPSLHDVHVAELEASVLVDSASAPALSEAECSYNDWVGKEVDEEAVKAVGRPYRILGPNAAATMDFNPERINVMVDDKNIVTVVRCG